MMWPSTHLALKPRTASLGMVVHHTWMIIYILRIAYEYKSSYRDQHNEMFVCTSATAICEHPAPDSMSLQHRPRQRVVAYFGGDVK